MRMLGLFIGGHARRNDPVKLASPHELERYYTLETGDAGKDGYTVLSKANVDHAGILPAVPGQEGQAHQGPDQSFEQ